VISLSGARRSNCPRHFLKKGPFKPRTHLIAHEVNEAKSRFTAPVKNARNPNIHAAKSLCDFHKITCPFFPQRRHFT